MDDGGDRGSGGAVAVERVAWSEELGARIVARTAAGETLRGMCREEGMPAFRTVEKWLARKAEFRAAMHGARVAAGGPFRGRRPSWCEATAEAIWQRLGAGEPLVRICKDPAMPSWSTVMAWQRDRPAFGDALRDARAYFAESAFQTGWDICMGVTPATAMQCKVQLAHLRWHTGKLAPKRYGPAKPQAAEDAPESEPMTVIVKNFRDVTAEDYAEAEETERRFGG